MSDNPAEGEPPEEKPQGEVQQVKMAGVTARVPASVSQGVFSTGAVVMNGPNEFVIDFLQHLGHPQRVVARVVVPHQVVGQFVTALEDNLGKFEQAFGKPAELPKPAPGAKRPSINEIYDNLKLEEEDLSGSYANAVLIRHSAAEFSFDFVTNFFPNASVSARVFLSAPHVPPVLESLKKNYQQWQQRVEEQRRQQPPPEEGPAGQES